jgi:serine/threonine protein kinase
VALITGLIGAIKGENLILSIESTADLILGHESLLDAGILHRDISTGNIMLTEQEDDGFLIDMDLAINLDNDKASGAPGEAGTKVFMAIGPLYGEPHNFMHDLESIFWVPFWVCVHWDGPDRARRKVKGFENGV